MSLIHDWITRRGYVKQTELDAVKQELRAARQTAASLDSERYALRQALDAANEQNETLLGKLNAAAPLIAKENLARARDRADSILEGATL